MGEMTSNSTEDGLWMAVLNLDNSNFKDGTCCASGKTQETWETLGFSILQEIPSAVSRLCLSNRPILMGRGARLPQLCATVLQRLTPESEPMTASAGFLKAIQGMNSNLLGSETEMGWKK